jgi:hypothetical protein
MSSFKDRLAQGAVCTRGLVAVAASLTMACGFVADSGSTPIPVDNPDAAVKVPDPGLSGGGGLPGAFDIGGAADAGEQGKPASETGGGSSDAAPALDGQADSDPGKPKDVLPQEDAPATPSDSSGNDSSPPVPDSGRDAASPVDPGADVPIVPPAGVPLANETLVGRQWGADVAALKGGGFAVSWMSVPPYDDTGWASGPVRVAVRVYAADGTPETGETWVAPDSDANQGFPAVTGLSGGGMAVVWPASIKGDEEYTWELRGRALDARGEPAGPEIRLGANGNRPHGRADLCALEGGNVLLTWSWPGYDGDGDSVVARLLRPTLSPLGANFLPAEVIEDTQTRPRCGARPGGGFVISWDSTITRGYDVRLRAFAADGAPEGPEMEGNPYQTSGVQRGAVPLGLPTGEILIAYSSDSFGSKIWVRLLDVAGDTLWANEAAPSLIWRGQPAVAAHPEGATVYFQARPQATEALAIYAVPWKAEGRELGAARQVFASETQNHSPVAEALLGGGRVVVWDCRDGDGEGVCFAVEE